MALAIRSQARIGRLIVGGILMVVGLGLALYGYFAPPQLRFEDNRGFVAAPGPNIATGEFWGSFSVFYDEPVYPYPRKITAVSIPDSPLRVEWRSWGNVQRPWLARRGIGLNVWASEPGQYVITRIRIEFGELSRVYDVGRVVVDARVADILALPQGLSMAETDGQTMVAKSDLATLTTDALNKAPLTLLRVEAGEFGAIDAPKADEDGNVELAFRLPPVGDRPRAVYIRPWLIVSDGKKQMLAMGMSYANWPR